MKRMIYLDTESRKPLYQQLYEQLKHKIVAGEYPKGKRLTATREMARALSVARNTVEAAYEQLCVEGYLASRQGSGFVVQDVRDGALPPYRTVSGTRHAGRGGQQSAPVAETAAPEAAAVPACRYDFQYGNLSPRHFPRSLWRRLTAEALASFDSHHISSYGDKQGELPLRKEIARYLHESRGVDCSPGQIVLCSGHQEALGIVCTLFATGNREVAVEEPGYDLTRIVFENHGYRVDPVPVEDLAISIRGLRQSGARLVYTTPSHQFPLGGVMPIGERIKLLAWAEQADAVVVEDDYDSELRYHTRPVPALQSIDGSGRVIYLGTFSKALSPGLRMGYLVLPERILPRYHAVFRRYKSTVPWLQQQVVTRFMAEGHWEKHLRRWCLENRKKRDALMQAIQDEMAGKVRVMGEKAGLHILLALPEGGEQEELIGRAAALGVKVYPTRQFWHREENAAGNLVLLGFSSLGEEEIREGIALLRKAWFG